MEDTTVWVDFRIMRGPKKGPYGYVVHLRTHPLVEEFSKQRSGSITGWANDHADYWLNVNDPNKSLRVYEYSQNNANISYSMDNIGQPMFLARNRNRGLVDELRLPVNNSEDFGRINLSILKLVGISNPEGIDIGFNGIHSLPYLKAVKAEFTGAIRSFVLDYITPVDLNVQIISQ